MRPRSLILIDEPESHLHAAVQTKFLRALGSYAEYGVVFATHSIGLARCMADRVYQVSALRQGESELAAFDSSATLSEVAGELAYAAQAELGSTALLLVEGPTDVRTFQELLRLFALEDRFVVLPLGGDGMVRGDRRAELEELQRITHRIAAVLDSERNRPDEGAKPHRLAFARTCDGLSMPIRCRVLDRRSIENYFTERAVRRVKGDRCRALGPFETLRGAGNLWDKAENWLIAREMQREELDNDLGDFLVSLQEL